MFLYSYPFIRLHFVLTVYQEKNESVAELALLLFVRRMRRGPSHHPFLWGWGGHFLCVRRWLMRPICAWKSLLQWGQGMVAGARGCRAFSFLSFLRLSAVVLSESSWRRAPLWTAARHLDLSEAVSSHVTWLIPKAFRDAFIVSL